MAFRWMKTLAFVLLHITGFTAVLLGDFYPYGTSEGDTALPPNDDGSSGVIPILSPFPYFDQNHGSLYVNTNGVVSFLEDVSQYTPDPFPLGDNRRLISPFWGDVDTRNGGFVTYRETTDTLLLQRATDDVRRAFLNHQRFQATWIFIATWDRVAFFGASEEATQKVNTFQTVLATNGRHSFAIFNYNQIMWTTGTASGGDDQGLGGTPAQGGFNAGDGIRFFVIPGSRTNDILNLPSTSNVARDGQWMFQTDEATVEAGGCDAKGSLTISPRSGMMLGGTNIKMSGPCFTAEDVIVVQFDNELNINATFGNELQSTVTVPVLNKTGRLPIKLSVDGGHTFKYDGVYTSVAINRHSPSVERSDGDIWQEDSSVDISWDSGSIGGVDDQVSIELARYKMDEDEVPILDSFHTTVESQSNTGHSQFTVTRGEGDGEIDDRFVNLVRVSRKDSANNSVSQAQWVWSDVFTWNNAAVASERCKRWHQKEPNPDSFKDPSLQPCPLLLTQAMADRGRYMSDEMCNPLNQAGCSQYHKGAAHCFTTVNPSAKGAAQQCCYNNFGNLMMSQPNAGSLDRVHPNAGLPVISHFFHDIVPFRDCCRLSDDCEKYFEKRPSDDGSQYQAPRPATGFGDPHMVTLDGTPFTFNGYGEYVILKVSGVEFTLQGRMEPLMGDDGVVSRATVYTAFAAKENGSDTVQIHLNGRGMVDVLVSGEKANFDELSLLQYDGVSVLQYANTSKFSAIFDSGISVTVDGQQELLGLVTLVPTIFKGNTSGLLGYWDDNQEQEFLRPDGTFLKTNSSLEDIHTNFGQLWVTSAQESLFIYQQGKSHSTYHHPEYVPIFPDTQSLTFDNKSLEQEAQSVCGENKECMFDIYTTGKVRIGRATKETVQQFVAVVNDTVKPACVPLNARLPNGVLLRNDTEGGLFYKFTCNRGFVLNGSSHVTCKDGAYNGSAPNCLPRECPVPFPGNITNGYARGNGSVYRSMYHYTCNDGYVLVGQDTIVCTEIGTWNGTEPKCLKECPKLQAFIPNGSMSGSGSLEGSLRKFGCNAGYWLVGRDILYCTEEGKWNASFPSCLRECPTLPSLIANGYVNGSASVEGSYYRFSCKKGYLLSGADTLHCSDEGKWSGSVPTCLIECPQLPSSIPNGNISGSGSVQGSLYRFDCKQGYALLGQSSLLCTEKGSWNASIPSCLKECPTLPSSVPNGHVNSSGSVEGSQYRFSCKTGYSLVGEGTLYCSREGTWNGSVPTCLIECPQLPASLNNGHMNGSGYVQGSLYRFSCMDGYSLVGQNTLYCSEEGKWNASTPSCLKECSSLPSSIPNGYVNGSGSLEGSHYRFSCKKGFSLVGADTLYCSDEGKWNGSLPACLIECPVLPLSIANGYINGSGHVEDSYYRFSCNKGFSLVGADILLCTDGGTWNGSVPTCLIECLHLPLSIPNGFINGSGSVRGSQYRFSCKDGYSLVGRDNLYCTEQGSWNASVPSCLKECPVLPSSITNGYVNGSGSLEGSHYRFSCNKGFSLVGADTLHCSDAGKWNGSLPTCLIECPVLPSSLTNGYINGSGHVEGSHYRFSCNKGFSLMGADTLHCSDEGKWNGSLPSCLKECPVLPSSITNGFVNGSGSVEGSHYSFSCNKGFSLVGAVTLYCTDEGTWNGSIPSCLKECPSLSSSITNGYINGSGHVEGSYYRFNCNKGFSLVGAETLYCSDGGTWNGTVPTCLIGCPGLSLSFPNGVVTGSGSVHGSLYRFRCKDGYSLIGWSVVSCTHQGIWNASIPSCLKECPPLQSSITNGFVNGSGAVEGSHYRFTCNEGFSLMGTDTLYCTGNGSWNGSAPTCLTVSVRQEATEVAWYVYASSGGGALVFILIIVSLVVLLWRLRKSPTKQHEHEGGEELEMKPNKTQVYLAVRRFSDPTPIAV